MSFPNLDADKIISEAKSGNPESQYILGRMYGSGDKVKQNTELAVYWFYQAAVGNNINALSDLSDLYLRGIWVEKNEKKAFELREKAANLGDINSMYLLGLMFESSIGCETDIKKAMFWLTKAAKAGNIDAQQRLEKAESGLASSLKEKDTKSEGEENRSNFKSSKLLEEAEKLYNLGMAHATGKGAPRNKADAKKYLKLAAEKGSPDACFVLGYYYETGFFGRKDLDAAEKMYLNASEYGDYEAMGKYAAILLKKEDCSKYYEEAAKWLKIATYQGGRYDIGVNLALLYEEGHGVDKNISESVRLLNQARMRGVITIIRDLRRCALKEYNLSLDYLDQWENCSRVDDCDLLYNLGTKFIQYGKEEDYLYDSGILLLAKAAMHGHEPSYAILRKLGRLK